MSLLDELENEIDALVIDDFRFDYRWLSNYHIADVVYEGITYPSTEHAYQAAKTLDVRTRLWFSMLERPRDAKREGKNIVLRDDWEDVKLQVMYDVCLYKFSQHEDLKTLLLETGNAKLIEGNWWKDTYWGVCDGVGKNMLGKILMEIREELKK